MYRRVVLSRIEYHAVYRLPILPREIHVVLGIIWLVQRKLVDYACTTATAAIRVGSATAYLDKSPVGVSQKQGI